MVFPLAARPIAVEYAGYPVITLHPIERLEFEARRLAGLTGDGSAASAQRKQVVADVTVLRRAGEINSYIDLLFLAMIVLLCISKVVTN